MIRPEYLIRNRDKYNLRILPQLVVLGAESSLGDPFMGGPLTSEGFNFGCIKWRSANEENAVWTSLSNGQMERRGVLWFTFPTPEIGMEAWGRYIATVQKGYVKSLMNAEKWPEFAAIYYGAFVPGLTEYVQNLQQLAERFKARAEEAGWDI